MDNNNVKNITALYERSATLNPENIRQQFNDLTNFAKRHDYKNLRHYSDDGYSGANTERPAYQQMMEDIRNDRVSVLIVRDMARLSRNMEAYARFQEDLDLHGVRLIAVNEKTDRLPLFIIDEHSRLRSELHGDYYLPILFDPEQENLESIGQWGIMRKECLEADRPGLFSRLLRSGKLMDHLRDVDKQANERFDVLMEDYKRTWNITEALKAEDLMRWVRLMNRARHATEWNIVMEIIFS